MLDFPRGFFTAFRGGRLFLRHPRLLKLVVIPFLINVATFSLAIYFGLRFFHGFVLGLLPQGEAWYWVVLYYAVWLIAGLLTLVLVFFCFTVVGNLIASPFNELLSERVESLLLPGGEGKPFSLREFWRDMLRIWLVELKKMSLFVGALLVLLLLNLLPVVGNLLYGVLSTLLILFFLAWEYLAFIHERKNHGFRLQRRYIMDRKLLMLGFASGVLLMLAIPLLQLLCIPVAVSGATLLWCEEQAGRRLLE